MENPKHFALNQGVLPLNFAWCKSPKGAKLEPRSFGAATQEVFKLDYRKNDKVWKRMMK